MGPQFEGTDGSTDINKLISGVTGGTIEDENFTQTAPHIQVPNATTGGYDLYYYLNDGWYDNGTEDGGFKPGWCDKNGMIAGEDGADADGVLIPGVAIWIKDPNLAETFQQAGQVPTDASVAVSVPVSFVLRANAYPVEFNLNDSTAVTFSGLTGGTIEDENFTQTAPHIQVPNATTGGYDLYYYLNDGWYDNGTEDGDFKAGWCDKNGMIAGEDGSDADGVVPVAAGFWAKGVGSAFTITFAK